MGFDEMDEPSSPFRTYAHILIFVRTFDIREHLKLVFSAFMCSCEMELSANVSEQNNIWAYVCTSV